MRILSFLSVNKPLLYEGSKWMLLFINDYSREYDHVYLINHKSKAVGCFQHYLAENKLGKSVKILKIDCG